MHELISSAPARICLFGDHQDYLDLPVIACAINRSIQIKAIPIDEDVFNLKMLDIGEEDKIYFNSLEKDIASNDFLRLALRVLRRYNCIPNQGYEIFISGDIPINAGVSSSSALTIAWIQFLVYTFGIDLPKTPELIARLAFETEVTERGSSGGKMDQFSIGLGGTIFLDPKDEKVEKYSICIPGLIVGVSGVAKDTFGTLSNSKSKALKSLEQVKRKFPAFDYFNAKRNDIPKYIEAVEPDLKKIFTAAIKNHDITRQAKIALEKDVLDLNKIGILMNEHHDLLKNNLNITVPLIDDMIDAALENGGIGAKIVGSGGGGCIVVIASVGKEKQVIESIKRAGAKDAFQVRISDGPTFQHK